MSQKLTTLEKSHSPEMKKNNLISNIVSALKSIKGNKKEEIIERQLCHFFRADKKLGEAIAKGLGLRVEGKALNT